MLHWYQNASSDSGLERLGAVCTMLRCAARAGLPSARLGRRRPWSLTRNANSNSEVDASPVLLFANVRLCDASWSSECSHQLGYGSRGLSSFSRFLRERGSPDALLPTSRYEIETVTIGVNNISCGSFCGMPCRSRILGPPRLVLYY